MMSGIVSDCKLSSIPVDGALSRLILATAASAPSKTMFSISCTLICSALDCFQHRSPTRPDDPDDAQPGDGLPEFAAQGSRRSELFRFL